MINNKCHSITLLICTMLFATSYGMQQDHPIYKKMTELWETAAKKGLTGTDLLYDILFQLFPITTGSKEDRKQERKDIIEALQIMQTKTGSTPQDIEKLTKQAIDIKAAMRKTMSNLDDKWPNEEFPAEGWFKGITQEAIKLNQNYPISLKEILILIYEMIDKRAQTKGKLISYSWWGGSTYEPADSQVINAIKERIKKEIETAAQETIKVEIPKEQPIPLIPVATPLKQVEQTTEMIKQEDIKKLWQAAKNKNYTGNKLLTDVLIHALTFEPSMSEKQKKEQYNKVITDLAKMKSDENMTSEDTIKNLSIKVLKAKKIIGTIINQNDKFWSSNSIPTNEWNQAVADAAIANSIALNILPSHIINIIYEIINQKAKTKEADSALIATIKRNITNAIAAQIKATVAEQKVPQITLTPATTMQPITKVTTAEPVTIKEETKPTPPIQAIQPSAVTAPAVTIKKEAQQTPSKKTQPQKRGPRRKVTGPKRRTTSSRRLTQKEKLTQKRAQTLKEKRKRLQQQKQELPQEIAEEIKTEQQ